MYIALIGDLVSSKQLKNRAKVQESFHALIKRINQVYADHLVSPFTITTGDEFQALLKPTSKLFQLIDDLSFAFVNQAAIRFGIGIGDIVTEINPEQSIGADGPAYWHARAAIDYVKEKDDYGLTQIAFSCDDAGLKETLNTLLASGEFIKAKWTAQQKLILERLLAKDIYAEKFDQKALATELSLSPSAVNKRLKASGLKIYLRTRQAAVKLIKDYMIEEGE